MAVTVEETATSFMDTMKGEGLNKDTLQKYRRMLALLLDYCHRKNLLFIRDVSLPHLTAHRTEWEKNLKSKLSRVAHAHRATLTAVRSEKSKLNYNGFGSVSVQF